MRQLELGPAEGVLAGPSSALVGPAPCRAHLALRRSRAVPLLRHFAQECNQCNAAKDGLCAVKGTNAGTSRLGEGGGFKEFDEEEEARRKRRAYEQAQEKAERKAEKRKCEYCKRASCIC